MVQFFISNLKTIALIYAIIGGLVFVIVMIFWIWVIKQDDEEERLYPEWHEDTGGLAFSIAIALFTSAACAVLWVGIPLIMGGVVFIDWFQKKFPKLMGDMCEDTEIEEDDDND